MNSDDLALFAHVARVGSLSRAALDLGVDQSTLSRRVGLLEADLGARLFHRSGRGVTPTERGEQLLLYADRIADTLDEAARELRESARRGPARLCVAGQPTIARILFGRLANALQPVLPDTRLRFVEGLASQILGRLDDGEIDVAILYLPERYSGTLNSDPLLSEDLHLVTPPDHPLADGPVPAMALDGLPLILPSTHHGLRVLTENLAARCGFSVSIALECDGSVSLTKRLVRETGACTVLPPAAVMEEVASGRLKSHRIETPAVTREVAVVWPRKSASAEDLGKVTRIIRRCSEELVAEGAWPEARLLSARPIAV